jgi:hypothetical protein
VCPGSLEQQSRSVRGQNASANLGHLEMGIDFRADALEQATALELGEEIAKISVFHGNVLVSYPFLCINLQISLICRGPTTLVASHSRHNLSDEVFRDKTGWTEPDPVAMLIPVGLCGGPFSPSMAKDTA